MLQKFTASLHLPNSTILGTSSSDLSLTKDEVKGMVGVVPTDANNDSIHVSYQDEYAVWRFLEEPLKSRIAKEEGGRLKVDVWKTRNEFPSRTISVQLAFLPSDSRPFEYSVTALNRYLKPYVNLILVGCEDVDFYKKQIRNRVKAWTQSMSTDNKEFIVVFVSLGNKTQKIYDKLKSDLKQYPSRCFQLKVVDSDTKSELQWQEFLNKMRESIATTFEQIITEYVVEVSKADSQRMSPGYNYCHFFLLKEALAFTYERAGLIEESLKQYFELEVLFMETVGPDLKKKIEPFGGKDDGDDDVHLLRTDKKKYRHLLYSNSITEFDFRHYLFARQSKLLLVHGKHIRVLKDVIVFIQRMSRDIINHSSDLSIHFISRWAFSACIRVANLFWENYLEISPKRTKMASLLGELFDSARSKLETLGKFVNVIPVEDHLFFGKKFDEYDDISQKPAGSTSLKRTLSFRPLANVGNEELRSALNSIPNFDRLYFNICSKALQCYSESNQFRSVVRMNQEMALIYYLRENYKDAESLLKNVCTSYSQDGWFQFVFPIRERLAECQRQLKHSSEYVTSCYELLSPNIKMIRQQRIFYTEELVSVSKISSVPIVKDLYPLMNIKISWNDMLQFKLGEIIQLNCTIYSSLICDIPIDSFVIRLADGPKEIKLSLSDVIVHPKENQFLFRNEAIQRGEFQFDKISLQIGQLILNQPLSEFRYPRIIVTESEPSLKIDLVGSDQIIKGSIQCAHLRLDTRNDTIINGKITIDIPNNSGDCNLPKPSFKFVQSIGESSQFLIDQDNNDDKSIVLHNISKNTIIDLFIPVRIKEENTYKIPIIIAYEKNTEEKFVVKDTITLSVIDPFDVSYYIIPIDTSKFYVQIIFESKFGCLIDIIDHTIKLHDKYHFFNLSEQNQLRMRKGLAISSVIEIRKQSEQDIDEQNDKLILELRYKIPYYDEEMGIEWMEKTIYDKLINVPLSLSSLYQIEASIPSVTHLGAVTTFIFSIKTIDLNSNHPSTIDCLINTNSNWLIYGPLKFQFDPKKDNGHTRVVTKAVPINLGFIPTPDIQLVGVNKNCIKLTKSNQNVYVYPNESIHSSLMETQIEVDLNESSQITMNPYQ